MMREAGRKGQVPVLMLFVVTIILVITALITFFNFDRNFNDNPLDISNMLAKVQFGEEYITGSAKLIAAEVIMSDNGNSSLHESFVRVAAEFDRQITDPANNFSAKIREGHFSFENKSSLYILKINGLFVKASYGNNEMTRTFNLCMLFDSEGNYLEPEIGEGTEKQYALHCAQMGQGL